MLSNFYERIRYCSELQEEADKRSVLLKNPLGEFLKSWDSDDMAMGFMFEKSSTEPSFNVVQTIVDS